jgi:hypothetical protein
VKPGTTCTENVTVGYLKNIGIATDWMKTFNLNGKLTIQSSHTIEIQGMIVTNPSGDGIDVTASTDVTLTFVSSVNNHSIGLALDQASQANISGAGTFSNNGSTGINVFANSTLYLIAWGGTVDISNNIGIGLNVDRAVAVGFGNTTINNNQLASGGTSPPNGFGVNGHGGAKTWMVGLFGPTTIASNAGGGVSVQQTSEIEMGGNVSWAPYLIGIQGNGPLGVAAVDDGQVTIFGGVTIANHTVAGVRLYGNSQFSIDGVNNTITNNGTGTDADHAGILVEQGSQAHVSDATIQNNGGPGVLGLLHATLDVEGSTFTSNAGGAIVCDGSTALETDLPHSVLGSANACTVSIPRNQHPQRAGNLVLSLPDWRGVRARSIGLSQVIAQHHLAAIPLAK